MNNNNKLIILVVLNNNCNQIIIDMEYKYKNKNNL